MNIVDINGLNGKVKKGCIASINHKARGVVLIMNERSSVVARYDYEDGFFINNNNKEKLNNSFILKDNQRLFNNEVNAVYYKPCLLVDAQGELSICSGRFDQIKNDLGKVIVSSLNITMLDYKSILESDILAILNNVKKHPGLSMIESKILFLKVVMKNIKCQHISSLLNVSESTVYTYSMNIKSKINIFNFKGSAVVAEIEKFAFLSNIATKVNINLSGSRKYESSKSLPIASVVP